MRIIFQLEEIYGKNPREVAKLFRQQGINPSRPYRARVSSRDVTVEQEGPDLQPGNPS